MADRDDDQEPAPAPAAPRPTKRAEVQSSPIIRLMDAEVTPADYALADRLASFGGDHRLLAARLVRAIEADKETSGDKLADRMMEAQREHDKTLAKLSERLDAIAGDVRDFKTGIRLAKTLGGAALTIAIAIASFVVVRMLLGERETGAWGVRLDHDEKRGDRMQEQFDRALERERVMLERIDRLQPRDKP